MNIEQIVSQLQRLSRLGGFHFNDRKYGDDDLIVGSIDPFQLFLIFAELVATGAFETGVRLTIDQSHNVEPKLEAMIQSVVNLQEAYAKALLVDRAALEQAQRAETCSRATACCSMHSPPMSARSAPRSAPTSAPRRTLSPHSASGATRPRWPSGAPVGKQPDGTDNHSSSKRSKPWQ